MFSRKWSVLSKLSNVCVQSCLQHSLLILLMSAAFPGLSSVSFLILIICVFSLFLSVLLEVFKFYCSFQRTSSLIFYIVLQFSILIISTVIFIISSVLLVLGLFHFSFSQFLRWDLWLMIWELFCWESRVCKNWYWEPQLSTALGGWVTDCISVSRLPKDVESSFLKRR